MKFLNEYLQRAETPEVKNYISTIVAGQIDKLSENVNEIEHVIDYLNAYYQWFNKKYPDKNFSKNISKIPYNTAVKKSEKWTKRLVRLAKTVVELDNDVELIHTFTDGFRLVKLIGKNAYSYEGNMMAHCVSSFYGKSGVKIYSLRDSKNKPHCTIEVTNSGEYIQQIKGRGNGKIHPRYIKMVLESLKLLGQKINENELPNLGYHKLSCKLWKIIDTKFTPAKYLTFNNTRYFYIGNNLKLKG